MLHKGHKPNYSTGLWLDGRWVLHSSSHKWKVVLHERQVSRIKLVLLLEHLVEFQLTIYCGSSLNVWWRDELDRVDCDAGKLATLHWQQSKGTDLSTTSSWSDTPEMEPAVAWITCNGSIIRKYATNYAMNRNIENGGGLTRHQLIARLFTVYLPHKISSENILSDDFQIVIETQETDNYRSGMAVMS